MFGRYCVLLLVLGLSPGRAVRVHPSQTPPPVVAGTRMLDEAEMAGSRPLFIDAFFDHAKPVAHVILDMKSFVEPTAGAAQEWGAGPEWTCQWADRRMRLSEGAALVSGYTNVDALAGAAPRAARPADASAEASFTDSDFHWALVISCPVSSFLVNSTTAFISLIGKRGDEVAYSRVGIPVSRSRFVRSGADFALCTMVQRTSLAGARLAGAAYLQPWAQYHVALGFDQLLVYVEEEDTAWAEKALRKAINRGQVTIVPFYFGNVSERRTFLLQGAMESHCLYQARGMAKWLAHADIDEYFDFMQTDVNMRNFPLPGPSSRDVALVVRSRFWGNIPDSRRMLVKNMTSRYPCNINAQSMYTNGLGHRSKVIMRPDYVDGLFPHFVVKAPGYKEAHPDPYSKLRLNHFKLCDTSGEGCFGNTQENEKNGKKRLVDDGNDWRERCEALVAAGA